MPTLDIHLLGDFRLSYEGELVKTIVQPRLQALLAYLLLHRATPQARQYIANLFWPDSDEPQALTNLRQLLNHLRRVFPATDQYLQVENRTLQWKPEGAYTLDVQDFEHEITLADSAAQKGISAAERIALDSAIQHYHGNLFPGCYDEWIIPEQKRLHQAFITAIKRLIQLTELQRDYSSAITYAERLLLDAPWEEITYRDLMKLHALNGDRANALQVYHTCVSYLERELGVKPDKDTQEAYQRLLNLEAPTVLGAATLPPPSTTRLDLVGRQGEWNALQSAWRRAIVGHPAFVVISGEAGIGKTRLGEELMDWADQQGFTTARTRSYAAEGRLAYSPVTELLRTNPLHTRLSRLDNVWLTELALLMPELLLARQDMPKPGPITDSLQRERLFEALARAMLNDSKPLLLLLDDVQWCDQDTLDWFHFLLHYDPRAKLLILGTVRPEEIYPAHPLTLMVEDLRIHDQVIDIELEPLNQADTAALAEQMARRKLEADQAVQLYQQSEGNPFYIVEMVRAQISHGEMQGEGIAEAVGSLQLASNPPHMQGTPFDRLPPKILSVIRARLGQISPSARNLANLAAVIGRAFNSGLLAQASNDDEETLVLGLDELWRRRIIREQGSNGYDFSHDCIREVIYADLSPARRQSHHMRVAMALEQQKGTELDVVSGQIAAHYEQARRPEQAIVYYRRAAKVAQQTFSITEEINLLNRALSLLTWLPDNREQAQTQLSVLISKATALMWIKSFAHPEVEQTLLQCWKVCQPLGDYSQALLVIAGLWVCYHLRGDIKQETFWVEQLEREAQSAPDTQFLPVTFFALTGKNLFKGNFLAAKQYAERGFAQYQVQPKGSQDELIGYDPRIGAQGYGAHSLWLLGYPDQARKWIERAHNLAVQSTNPNNIVFTLSMGSVLHGWCGELSATLNLSEKVNALATEKGLTQWIIHSQFMHGWVLGQKGQFEKGLEEQQQALAEWQAIGARLAFTYYLLCLVETYATNGRFEKSIEMVNEGLAIVNSGGEGWLEAELHRWKGELLLTQNGDIAQVEACFQQALETARRQQARSLELRAAISLCRLWQRQGKLSAARQLLTEVYNWFSEGFDTADLQQANEMLHVLMTSS